MLIEDANLSELAILIVIRCRILILIAFWAVY